MDIGRRIRDVRKAKGLTQEELARRAGMSLKGMGDIERGDIPDPHYSSLSKIAEGLGVPITELLSAPFPVGKAEAPAGSGQTEAIESERILPHRGYLPIPTGDPSPEMQAERLRERAGYVRFWAEELRQLFQLIAKEKEDSEDRRRLAATLTLAVAGVIEKLDRQGTLQDLKNTLSTRERGVAVPDELREAALKLHKALGDLRKVGPQAVRVSRGESPESVIDAEQPKGEIRLFPTRSVEEEAKQVLEEVPNLPGDVGA